MVRLFSTRYHVVVSIFQRPDVLAKAYLAEENPWGDMDPLYSSTSDRIFMVAWNGVVKFHVGHVRVCGTPRAAEIWFASMRDRTNVWAYWRLGFPLGPFAEDQMYREADGVVKKMATFVIDARDQRDAAKQALERLQRAPETALEAYTSDDE